MYLTYHDYIRFTIDLGILIVAVITLFLHRDR